MSKTPAERVEFARRSKIHNAIIKVVLLMSDKAIGSSKQRLLLAKSLISTLPDWIEKSIEKQVSALFERFDPARGGHLSIDGFHELASQFHKFDDSDVNIAKIISPRQHLEGCVTKSDFVKFVLVALRLNSGQRLNFSRKSAAHSDAIMLALAILADCLDDIYLLEKKWSFQYVVQNPSEYRSLRTRMEHAAWVRSAKIWPPM